ncbi:MAG: Uma2 family endonuclease [Vulcanimicrobiota bacterium]
MLAHRERRRFTPAEYLALEERSETRSEFYRGEIFAMSGGTVEHNRLVRNLTALLDAGLRGSSCEVFVADMRLHVAAHELFTYPDLFVVCGPLPRMTERADTLVDAKLVVEVLSPSTEKYDRGEKFHLYQGLPSFSEYLLVRQDRIEIERHSRRSPDEWVWSRHREADQIELASIGLCLAAADIYRDVF